MLHICIVCCRVNRVAIAVGRDVINPSRMHRAHCTDLCMDYREGAVKDCQAMEMTSVPVQANTIPVGAEMSGPVIR